MSGKSSTQMWVANGIAAVLGTAAFTTSFSHVVEVAAKHGHMGWKAYTIAASVELLALASIAEMKRRAAHNEEVKVKDPEAKVDGFALPIVVMISGLALSLAANLATAPPNVWGYVMAAWTPLAFVMVALLVETRSDGSAAPTLTTEQTETVRTETTETIETFRTAAIPAPRTEVRTELPAARTQGRTDARTLPVSDARTDPYALPLAASGPGQHSTPAIPQGPAMRELEPGAPQVIDGAHYLAADPVTAQMQPHATFTADQDRDSAAQAFPAVGQAVETPAAPFEQTLPMPDAAARTGAVYGSQTKTVRTTEQTLTSTSRSDGRTGARPARTAPRTETRTQTHTERISKEEFVAIVAAEIRTGDQWRPDYPALEQAYGYKRSWFEKRIAEARTAAALPAPTGNHSAPTEQDDSEQMLEEQA